MPPQAASGFGRMVRYFEPHRGGRFASLDGYRAIAATGVLVYHVAGATKLTQGTSLLPAFLSNLGNFGVAVFFLLSGFLLYRPFLDAHISGAPSPRWGRFWRHRFLRIYPAYWLALTTFILVVGVKWIDANNFVGTIENLATVYLLVQVYRPLWGFSALSVAWTLNIEIAFYIALPFLAAFIRHVVGRSAHTLRTRFQAQLLGLGLLAVVAYAFRVAVVAQAGSGAQAARSFDQSLIDTTHLWLPNYFDWFALGMLLAVAVAWRDAGRHLPRAVQVFADRGWACWSVAGLAYLILMLIRSGSDATAAGVGKETVAEMCIRFFFNGIAALFFLLPGILGLRDRSPSRRALASLVPAYLGTISYGIYLWHKLWLDWLRGDPKAPGPGATWGFWPLLVATSCLTALAATASYFGLERPVLRFKDSRSVRRARAALHSDGVGAGPTGGHHETSPAGHGTDLHARPAQHAGGSPASSESGEPA